MREAESRSYYEIALTHSQIVTVFVVLLVCVVAAFFSGVWIGRRGADGTEVVQVAEQPEAAAAEEARSLDQLHFFSPEVVGEESPTEAAEEAPSEAAEEPPARPQPEDTLAVSVAEAAPESGRVPIIEDSGTESALLDELSKGQEEIERGTVADAAPAQPAAPPPTAAAGGDVVIQVFSSGDRQQAERLIERLRGGGHPAFLSPVEVDGRTMFRVRVGPYSERADAEVVADSVRREFRLDTWITQSSS